MEYSAYMASLMDQHNYNAQLSYARDLSKKAGLREGRKEIAKVMLNDGMKPSLVARYTKLTEKQIATLR